MKNFIPDRDSELVVRIKKAGLIIRGKTNTCEWGALPTTEPLLFGPSPVHPLPRLSEALGGRVEIWAKREDCNSGIAFGGTIRGRWPNLISSVQRLAYR